ncbi:FAD-binding oxidoreductase [Thioalkalivibrio paradoxus]|uniref:Dimethylmenaquinone methyltransferase n=1 Tax=Thioalkalivibrio paradoxus ARh 1 TaxID=713585 RepID=W0DPX5_9GAMM|nr:FAD-linked oxidase C-terminal domain-containing protein [Thioalkalivibrio paradoxus]AHE99287.1 dimethylmenaquinone methyltransferase [Thioalkalivibrio paradoxus ARh 1]
MTPLQRELERLLPEQDRLLDPADCWAYGADNSRLHAPPDAVAFARDSRGIVELVQLCRRLRAPLIVRGRGTGTTGAVVPLQGGLVLSTERMNRIVEVDPDNRWLVAEPGATNAEVQEAAGRHGFFWPPDPTSSAYCTVGGNLAYNSAGPRAVKYGTPRENTLGLAAVAGTGAALRTGVYTTKGVVGYDLTRLLIGSEGTLAVITEASLRLTPLPETRRLLQAVYRDMHAAAAAVARIMAQPVTPCALEFMDAAAIDMIRGYADSELPAQAGALLMIEVDGAASQIDFAAQAVGSAARGDGCLGVEVATSDADAERLWRTRKALSPALRNIAPKKINEDVVVPVSRIPELIDGLGELGRRHGIRIVNFGHAGNGNIHVNLLVDPDDPVQMQAAEQCLDEVFGLVLRLRGTLSGEHGVGLVKREFIRRELDPGALALMHDLRRVFDPDGILNPGKALPEPGAT